MPRGDGFYRSIRRLLQEQGWRVELLKNSHVRYWAPDGGPPVVGGGTPSDRRAMNELLADLKRRGLRIDPMPPLRARRRLERAATGGISSEMGLPSLDADCGSATVE